jgi:hypothetical protein
MITRHIHRYTEVWRCEKEHIILMIMSNIATFKKIYSFSTFGTRIFHPHLYICTYTRTFAHLHISALFIKLPSALFFYQSSGAARAFSKTPCSFPKTFGAVRPSKEESAYCLA